MLLGSKLLEYSTVIIKELLKLCALNAHFPFVLCALPAPMPRLPCALLVSVSLMSLFLRALAPYVPRALRFFVPHVPQVLSRLTCSRASRVPCLARSRNSCVSCSTCFRSLHAPHAPRALWLEYLICQFHQRCCVEDVYFLCQVPSSLLENEARNLSK